MSKVQLLSRAAWLLASMLASMPARAQIEDIVVTARRIEEDQQTVPVSIAAFDTALLEQRTVTDMTDLTRIVPSMRFQGQGSIASTDISVRGVARVPVGSGGPTTAVYFLDVPILNTTYLPTFDLGGLQVLRGPQGTLFGTSTIGGAILIDPTPPAYDKSGYLKLTGGRFDYRQAEGATNVTIADDVLAVRLAAQIRRRDGYVENIGVGPDFNDIHTNAYRASILFEPAAGLRNVTVFDHIKGNETGWATIAYQRLPLNPLLPPPVAAALTASVNEALALGHYRTNSNVARPYLKRDTWGLFNTTTWEIADTLTIKNIFSYRDSQDAFLINNDGLGVVAFENGRIAHEKDVTEELQLQGKTGRAQWIVGGFYQKTTPIKGGSLTATNVQVSNQTDTDRNVGLFANVELGVTDRLTVNAGYRHSWARQVTCISPVAAGLDRKSCDRFAPGSGNLDGFGYVRAKTDAPTWTIGIDWRATDDVFLYAAHRHGFRFGGSSSGNYEHPCLRGGTAPPCAVNVGGGRSIDISSFQSLDDEKMDDFELGIRSDVHVGGRKHRLNVTGFHYVYKNLVGAIPLFGLIDPTLPGAPFSSTIAYNSGEITSWGIEADAIVNPVEGLVFTLNGAYTHQKQTKAGVGPEAFPIPIARATLAAPRFAGSLAVQYTLPFRPFDSKVAINFDYFATGDWEVQAKSQPGYELANLRIDILEIAGSGFGAGFWVRNLFDEDYLQSPTFVGDTGLPARSGNFGDPRLWGFDLSYRW